MQVRRQNAFEARAIFYIAETYANAYSRYKNGYEDLVPIYSLNILVDSFYKDDLGFKEFILLDRHTHTAMNTDYLTIGFLELNKGNLYNENQRYWQKYFLNENVTNGAPEYIKEAASIIDRVNLGEEEREMLSIEEKVRADLSSIISTAKEDGIEQGKIELAQKLIEAGIDANFISSISGLPKTDIIKN